VVAATDASETAKSGAVRIDKDVATLKGESVRMEERIVVLKGEIDKVAAGVKLSQEGVEALRADLDVAKTASSEAKDAASKVAGLNDTVQSLLKSDAARQASSERMTTALQLQSLKRAIATGGGFAAELADVKAGSGSNIDLAPLEPFKDSGVPSPTELVKAFRPLANSAVETGSVSPDGNVVEKLVASAKSVIKIRRTDHAPDDKSTEAVIGRMELALKDGRLGDVLSNADTLTPEVKTIVKPVVEKVRARVAVDTAIADIEQKLKASLGAPPQAVSN
jgi:hypothetical protein